MLSRFRQSSNRPGALRATAACVCATALLPGAGLLSGCASPGATIADATVPDAPTVLLIHGLARRSGSLDQIGDALQASGHRLCYIDYASTRHGPPELLRQVTAAIDDCVGDSATVHAVTHSLGGILLRAYAREHRGRINGRVVMLAPPNGGSELSDVVERSVLLRAVLGPTAAQLGTGPLSYPNRLGPATFDVGVIAGTRSVHPLGTFLLQGDNDGTVTVERARLPGMKDFATVRRAHSFLMGAPEVVHETQAYLEEGCFSRDLEEVSYDKHTPCALKELTPDKSVRVAMRLSSP